MQCKQPITKTGQPFKRLQFSLFRKSSSRMQFFFPKLQRQQKCCANVVLLLSLNFLALNNNVARNKQQNNIKKMYKNINWKKKKRSFAATVFGCRFIFIIFCLLKMSLEEIQIIYTPMYSVFFICCPLSIFIIHTAIATTTTTKYNNQPKLLFQSLKCYFVVRI